MIYQFCKRLMDILLSGIATIVLSPIFIIAYFGIKISSPGPALFIAHRIGKDGKHFEMYKFRSMHMNNEKGHIITLRTDDRVFPFGRFMRKSKIDELPQLFNVFKGDMSIVGWRPEDEENAEIVFIGEFKEILSAKPGLTSPGSLYDYTHGEIFEDELSYTNEFMPLKMELELYYVQHQSMKYDVELILRTMMTIIQVVCGKKEFAQPYELSRVEGE